MNTEQQEAQELIWGKTKDLLLPSGRMVTIREQNGNDDDILSNNLSIKDLSNHTMFIQNLVIKVEGKSRRLTSEEMDKMLIKDKYFILFASRVHSIGPIIKFKYDWGKDLGGEAEYEDDLSCYIWDYTKEVPKEDEEGYFKYRMQPYPADAYDLQYKTLKSGKELSFRCLTISDERQLMKLDKSLITSNRELIQRDLKLKNIDGTWQKVTNFIFFSKADMIELHKHVNDIDTTFIPFTEIECPKEGVSPILYPIIASSDFFFPQEI